MCLRSLEWLSIFENLLVVRGARKIPEGSVWGSMMLSIGQVMVCALCYPPQQMLSLGKCSASQTSHSTESKVLLMSSVETYE